MKKLLEIADGLSLPLEFITETFGILAMRGAGKSNTAVRIAEQMYAAGLPFVTIDPKGDWWGVRSSEDGKGPGLPIPVFGGLHGDVPLEHTAGTLVADLIVDQRLTCILDISEFSKAQEIQFLNDFGDRLFRRNRDPLHLFCEEADQYIPQRVMREQARSIYIYGKIVKQGRFRGLGATLITQRSAVLNKDVLSQVGTLIAMRTTWPDDKKQIRSWIEHHAVNREILESLGTLENGEAWFCSPQWLKRVERVRFHRRTTFDSGQTPKMGRARPPAKIADIDLAAISQAMAQTIEKAKADDPKELRKKIVELQRELAAKPAAPKADPDVSRRLRDANAVLLDLREKVQRASHMLAQSEQPFDSARALLTTIWNTPAPEIMPTPTVVVHAKQPIAPATLKAIERTAHAAAGAAASTGTGARGERTVLIAIAQHTEGATREQISVLTGYKRSSRDTHISRLKSAGMIDFSIDGRFRATPAGIRELGAHFKPLPTGAALREYWLARLTGGEQKLFSAIVDVYPNFIKRDELDNCGLKRSARDTYLSRLSARQLLVLRPGEVRASDQLF